MFKVRSPLSRELAAWAADRGFGLWDWSSLPVVADAGQETFGEEAREQLLDHGRWLVLTHVQALCRPLWTRPSGGVWDTMPFNAWSAGELGKAIRSFCGPRRRVPAAAFDASIRAILQALRDRPERAKDLFRGADGRTEPEYLLLRTLLEQFLACEAYRPVVT
jgi:hypothetical protein